MKDMIENSRLARTVIPWQIRKGDKKKENEVQWGIHYRRQAPERVDRNFEREREGGEIPEDERYASSFTLFRGGVIDDQHLSRHPFHIKVIDCDLKRTIGLG